MPSTTQSVTGRSGVVRHERRWAADDPRAALLLVHGIAEHSGRYEHVGEAFAGADIDVAGFDLHGHGDSGGARGHVDSFGVFLDDVEELLEERRGLGVPVILMGHSLGGLICATYAESSRPAPDLLVLSAPALAAEVPGWQRVLAKAMSGLAPKLTIPSDFEGELLSRDEAVGNAYRDDPKRVRKVSTRLGNEIFSTMEGTRAHLDRITVPTYVLHGGDDKLVPTSASEGFESLPNATRVIHARLRHECLNEPEQVEVLAGIITWIDAQLAAADT